MIDHRMSQGTMQHAMMEMVNDALTAIRDNGIDERFGALERAFDFVIRCIASDQHGDDMEHQFELVDHVITSWVRGLHDTNGDASHQHASSRRDT